MYLFFTLRFSPTHSIHGNHIYMFVCFEKPNKWTENRLDKHKSAEIRLRKRRSRIRSPLPHHTVPTEKRRSYMRVSHRSQYSNRRPNDVSLRKWGAAVAFTYRWLYGFMMPFYSFWALGWWCVCVRVACGNQITMLLHLLYANRNMDREKIRIFRAQNRQTPPHHTPGFEWTTQQSDRPRRHLYMCVRAYVCFWELAALFRNTWKEISLKCKYNKKIQPFFFPFLRACLYCLLI